MLSAVPCVSDLVLPVQVLGVDAGDGEVDDSMLLAVPGVDDLVLAVQVLDVGVEDGAGAGIS